MVKGEGYKKIYIFFIKIYNFVVNMLFKSD
jgi:hypothetical protein